MSTSAGKSRTRYKGTLILLFPRILTRLLKKPSRGDSFSEASLRFRLFRVGMFSAEGIRFRRKSMVAVLRVLALSCVFRSG